MRMHVTIARAGGAHNRLNLPGILPLATVITAFAFAGCSVSVSNRTDVSILELEAAQPQVMQSMGRARVSFDRPLPERVTQQLCDEYTLVLITEEEDWHSIRRRLGLEPKDVDFSRGAVVGILAGVGESPNARWPIRLRTARVVDGSGWIEAQFSSGIYYPLRTAAYLDLAYVAGLRRVRRVCIYPGPRSFVIGVSEPDG